MDSGDGYDYSLAEPFIEPFVEPAGEKLVGDELDESYGMLWKFKKHVDAWTFSISRFQEYVYLRYRVKDKTSFFALNVKEKISVIEAVQTNYIVIVLREVKDDGSQCRHSHSIIVDISDNGPKFDMDALVASLNDSRTQHLIREFEDAKYVPWHDSTAKITSRRLNAIWVSLDRYAHKHVNKIPTVGLKKKPKKNPAGAPDRSQSAARVSASGGSGQGNARSDSRRRSVTGEGSDQLNDRPDSRKRSVTASVSKEAAPKKSRKRVAAGTLSTIGSSGSALTTVEPTQPEEEMPVAEADKFEKLQKNFWDNHKSCYVLGLAPFPVSIFQCIPAKDEYIIRGIEERVLKGVRKVLLNLGDPTQRQHLCLTPVDENNELLKSPPKDWKDIKDGKFMIINGQHSIAVSKEYQIAGCGAKRKEELQTWDAVIVWTLDAAKLVEISDFYNVTNHIVYEQPTWGNQMLGLRNVWIHRSRPTNAPEDPVNRRNGSVHNDRQYSLFTDHVVKRFKSINPENEGKSVKGASDLKIEIKIITLRDGLWKHWKEFLMKHSEGELIDPITFEKYNEGKFFKSSNFTLKKEFFKRLGHFTDHDFGRLAMHLLNKTPGRECDYPKVSVHKPKYLVQDNHNVESWVERRKKKKVVIDELMDIKPALQFRDSQGDVVDDKWRSWKKRHLFTSSTWDFLIANPKPSFFVKRLTNEAKLRKAKSMGEKFKDELTMFQRFMKCKYRLAEPSGQVSLTGLDVVARAIVTSDHYQYHERNLNLAILDVRETLKPLLPKQVLELEPFLTFLATQLRPEATEAHVWVWILRGEDDVKVAATFVASKLQQYDCLQSVYVPCKGERLYNSTTRGNMAPVPLVFLFKRRSAHANSVRERFKPEYLAGDNLYYKDPYKNNEAKWRVYSSELRMEFYLELLQCFAKPDENVLGIYTGSKCTLAAKMFGAFFYGLCDPDFTAKLRYVATFADTMDMNDFMFSNSIYSASYLRPLYLEPPLLTSVSPPSAKNLVSPKSPGREVSDEGEAGRVAAQPRRQSAEGLEGIDEYGSNAMDMERWEALPRRAEDPSDALGEDIETDTEFDEIRRQALLREGRDDRQDSDNGSSGSEEAVPLKQSRKMKSVITREDIPSDQINCSEYDTDAHPRTSDDDDKDSDDETLVPVVPTFVGVSPKVAVKLEQQFWTKVDERKERRAARKKALADEMARKDAQIAEAHASNKATQERCDRLEAQMKAFFDRANPILSSTQSAPVVGVTVSQPLPLPSASAPGLVHNVQNLVTSLTDPRGEDKTAKDPLPTEDCVASTPASQLQRSEPEAQMAVDVVVPGTRAVPPVKAPRSGRRIHPRGEDKSLPSGAPPETSRSAPLAGVEASPALENLPRCPASAQDSDAAVPHNNVEEQLLDYGDEEMHLEDNVPEEVEGHATQDTPAEGEGRQQKKTVEPTTLKSLHSPLAMKTISNGSKPSISGIQCSYPLSGSPDSAFKQVGGDLVAEPPERQRLTRSLLSGSVKSLSVTSESTKGSTRPSVDTGPYLMRTADDAASMAVDFSKGNVEDGVVDSPPSRGPPRTPICSPSPLKRVSSARGGSFSPTPRVEPGTNRKLDLPLRVHVADPRLEDHVPAQSARRAVYMSGREAASALGGQRRSAHLGPLASPRFPRTEDNESRASLSVGVRRLPSADSIHSQRYLRDHRRSLDSKSTGSGRSYINNVDSSLPRPPPRGFKSASTSEVSGSTRKRKSKDSGSHSADFGGLPDYRYTQYPSRREDIFRARDKQKALEAAKSNCKANSET